MKDELNSGYGVPILISEGPFAGWTTYSAGVDPFETLVGPFCRKKEADGRMRCAFQPGPQHLNGGGMVHGAALLSFADFALFGIAHDALASGLSVTLTCNAEFLSPGGLDGWIEAEGEVVRAGRSVLFVRGLMKQKGNTLLMFSGTLKKIGTR